MIESRELNALDVGQDLLKDTQGGLQVGRALAPTK